jgi:Phytanoyl-CoA dioxygenase (PhyH)
MIFRRRRGRNGGGTAVVDRDAVASATLDELNDQIAELSAKNRQARDPDVERQIRRLRHLAGIKMIEGSPPRPQHVKPAADGPTNGAGLPEVAPSELTAPRLRAGILGGGCLLVRRLVADDEAARLANEIEKTFQARETIRAGGASPEGYYDEIEPEPPFGFEARSWVGDSGGVAAVDSPRMMFDMLETFERAGLRRVIGEYLGEDPVISFQKCTLRKAEPSSGGEWHQDGAFLSNPRALNVWLALSHCGDDAPGMDIVPRRLDHLAPTGTDGALFNWSVSQSVAEELAGDTGVMRPIFERGDVLFFDDFFLHKTAADPRMPNPRYAIESWFFGPSGYPPDYSPVSF